MSNNVVSYKASKTMGQFHRSTAFVRGVKGPYGSGKSVGMCWEIFLRARKQAAGTDGKRRTRFLVVRNTLPQLETTTIKTWLDWFPEAIFGKMNRKPPYTHTVKFEDVICEVIFLALDKPEDMKKLLSFEVTGIWFNEAREIPFEILQAATGRVGRYPARKDKPDDHHGEWPTWSGIIMDTNPPDDDHWWYRCDVENDWARDEKGSVVPPSSIDQKYRWEFFSQPSGLSPEAENLDNLPNGRGYYTQQLGGKSKDWINVYIHGNYGYVKHGLPVFGRSFDPERHVVDNLKINPAGKIYVGVDASGRHPAAVFAQRSIYGQWQVIDEISVQEDEGMGAVSFARFLRSEINIRFPNNEVSDIWCDPAGEYGATTDERTYFDILRANGLFVKASPGLRLPDRLETVSAVLESNIGKDPKILISSKCKILVRGFVGGYRFKKINTSGDARYDIKPEKNRFSDVNDALQYLLCGAGEMAAIKRGHKPHVKGKTYQGDIGFSVL
jgi:hypothetical protein